MPSKNQLPEVVQKARKPLIDNKPLKNLLQRYEELTEPTREHITMWNTLEKYAFFPKQEEWVLHFVSAIDKLIKTKKHNLKNSTNKNHLYNSMSKAIDKILAGIKDNDLDLGIKSPDYIWMGDYISKRGYFDGEDTNLSEVLELYKVNLKETLLDSNKVREGENADAIYFIRGLAEFNKRFFHEILYSVIITLVNEYYGTEYTDSDISNFLNRRNK